jgi:hypothetical protein
MYVVFDEELLQPSALSDESLNFGCWNTTPRRVSRVTESNSVSIQSAVALRNLNAYSANILVCRSEDTAVRAINESPLDDIA